MSPGTPDRERIERLLWKIDRTLHALRPHQGRPLDALVSDETALLAVEHGLQLCAQAMIDVAIHVVTSFGQDVASYAEAPRQLARLGIVPPQLGEQLARIARFRNVLVHLYVEVDVAQIHAILNRGLDDFVAFRRAIEAWLASI